MMKRFKVLHILGEIDENGRYRHVMVMKNGETWVVQRQRFVDDTWQVGDWISVGTGLNGTKWESVDGFDAEKIKNNFVWEKQYAC